MKLIVIRRIAWSIFLIGLMSVLTWLYHIKPIAIPTDTPVPQSITEEKNPTSSSAPLTATQKAKMDYGAFSQAISGTEEAACNQIQFDENLKAKCLDSLRYMAIINRRNTKDCAILTNPETKEFCVNKIHYLNALDRLDADLCKAIKEDELKKNCLIQVELVMNPGEKSLSNCGQIQEDNLKGACLSQYYYEVAMKNRSKTDCSKIEEEVLRNRCLRAIGQTQVASSTPTRPLESTKLTNPLEVCNNLSGSDKTKCRDKSNFNQAFESKELSYCSRITSTELKEKCQNDQGNNINRYYLRMAMANKDSALCSKILDEEVRTSCLSALQ